MRKDTAIVWQPSFTTDCFRAACNQQKGEKVNYIICTCSPSYNGVYAWDATKKYEVWNNKKKPCYCIPVSECKYLGPLEDIKSTEIRKEVIKEQISFTNRYLKNKPEWLLRD